MGAAFEPHLLRCPAEPPLASRLSPCSPRRGGTFLFSFAVPTGYPHDPPKVKCLTKVYHPNIDLEVGRVCWMLFCFVNCCLRFVGCWVLGAGWVVAPRRARSVCLLRCAALHHPNIDLEVSCVWCVGRWELLVAELLARGLGLLRWAGCTQTSTWR